MLLKKNKAEFLNCNLAGFGHTEGYAILDRMHAGDRLLMVREEDNRHDNDAIALFYVPKQKLSENVQTHLIGFDGRKYLVFEDEKLVDVEADLAASRIKRKSQHKRDVVEALHVGYIPASSNSQLASMLDMGYAAIYECVITRIDKEAHPNQQVQIRVNVLQNK